MHLRHSLRNKLPGGTNCPDPFDSCNTRGNFFSQLLDMTAPGKVSLMSTPRDFDVDTWFTGVPLMLRTGEAVRALSFCLDSLA